MFKAIDDNLIYLFGGPVNIWCSWTGKSNFVLAKVVLILSVGVLVADIILLYLFSWKGRSHFSVFMQVLLVIFWLVISKSDWDDTTSLEKEIKDSENQEVLPVGVYVLVEGRRFRRLVFLPLGIYILSLDLGNLLAGGHFDGRLIGLFFTLHSAHQYIRICFNGGTGGKIQRVIRKLLDIKFWRVPVIRPTPA